MAIQHRLPIAKLGVASLVWLACTAALAIASIMLGWKLLFGEDYRAQALKDVLRIEFDVTYEDGNAIPRNLVGETISLETALAMSEAASALQTPAQPDDIESPEESPTLPAGSETTPDTPATVPAVPLPTDGKEGEAPTAATSEQASPPSAEQPATDTPLEPLRPPPPVLAPVEQLTDNGIIPIIAKDGTMPWQYFAKRDYPRNAESPRIAVIVQGLGLSRNATETAIALPQEVTLSFSPYGRETAQELAATARGKGHEIMLDLPMQTERYPAVDPGPYGLRTDLSPAENHWRLMTVLTKLRGYVGLLAPARDSLSLDRNLTGPLIDGFSAQGLLFVSGYSQQPEGMFRLARQARVPILFTHVELDSRIDETYIRNQLARAEDTARSQGYAVVVGRPYPITLELLDAWTKELTGKGFTIVPVTALAGMSTGQ